jgi:pre-mRNA-processing factor 8
LGLQRASELTGPP